MALNTKNQKKEAPASTQKPFCQFARNILRAIFCFLQTAMLHSQMCFDLTSTFIARLFALATPSSDLPLDKMCSRFFVINSITTYLNGITLKHSSSRAYALTGITTYLNDITLKREIM